MAPHQQTSKSTTNYTSIHSIVAGHPPFTSYYGSGSHTVLYIIILTFAGVLFFVVIYLKIGWGRIGEEEGSGGLREGGVVAV